MARQDGLLRILSKISVGSISMRLDSGVAGRGTGAEEAGPGRGDARDGTDAIATGSSSSISESREGEWKLARLSTHDR